MPKVPRQDLDQIFDPSGQEHNPTMEELKAEEQHAENIRRDLFDIDHQLRDPESDLFYEGRSPYNVRSPDDLWDRLMWLKEDHLNHIQDPELQRELLSAIKKVERKIYAHFVPYIDAQIYIYGQHNSPLEKHTSRFGKNVEDVLALFTTARSMVGDFQLSEQERILILSELSRLQEKLERYRHEPTLFTFEQKELALHEKVRRDQINEYFSRSSEAIPMGNEQAQADHTTKLNLLVADAHELLQIAERMLHKDTRSDCQRRAQGLMQLTEQIKNKFESPERLLRLQAQLRDLLTRAKNKEEVDEMNLEDLESEIDFLSSQNDVSHLNKLADNIRRALAGENVEDERLLESTDDINWAWTRLDISQDATNEDIKTAYHALVLKYHPDRNKSPDAEEKMKAASEAYEFLRRIKRFR